VKFSKILFLISIISVLTISPVLAEFHVSPNFFAREEYNDNIYLDHSDKENDFVTLIRPSFNLTWNNKIFDLNLNLGLEYEKYFDHSEEDDLRPSQGTRLDSTWNLYRNSFFLRVSDVYQRVPIDEGNKGGVDNNLVNLTDSNRLIINPYLVLLPLKTLQVRFDYEYENIWYQDKAGDDAERHRYSCKFTKEITSRISADISGNFSQYRPRNQDRLEPKITAQEEYDRSDLSIGFLYNISDQLSLYGSVGRSWLDYTYGNDYESTLVSGQFDYEIASFLTVGAGYAENVGDSVDEGVYKEKKYSTYIHYMDGYQLGLTLFKARSNYLSTSQRRDSWGADLNGDFPITDKEGIGWLLIYTDYEEEFTGASSLSEINSFDDLLEYLWYLENPSEDYKRYGARIELYHHLRLGRASIGYTFNRNNSEINENDYVNNIIFMQIALNW